MLAMLCQPVQSVLVGSALVLFSDRVAYRDGIAQRQLLTMENKTEPDAQRPNEPLVKANVRLRVIGGVLYALLATPPLASSVDDARTSALVAGLAFAGIFLAIVGSLNWLIQRALKHDRPWWHATLSPGPYFVSWLLAIASAAGNAQ